MENIKPEIVEFKFDITNSHVNGAIAYIAVTIHHSGHHLHVPLLAVQEYNSTAPFSVTCGRRHSVFTAESTWFVANYIENGLDPRQVFSETELYAVKAAVEDELDMKSRDWPKRATEIISNELGAPVYFS